MLACLALSVLAGLFLILGRQPLLRLIFGRVEPAVMDAAVTYMLITAASYPFLALYTAGAALFRAVGDAKPPMLVAAGADVLNIIGNAVFIFVCRWGVMGAALSTLLSRIVSMAVMLRLQGRAGAIAPGPLHRIRPDPAMIRRILRVGLPNAVENGMFQFGRLMVQSTVSALGTTAIAVQALVLTLELFGSMPAQAVGTGLLTVAGQCVGRGLTDEARYHAKRLTRLSTIICIVMGLAICLPGPLILRLTALTGEGQALACRILWVVLTVKVFLWPNAFTLPNAMRAAGDVNYAMWVSTVSMWVFRVTLSFFLCRFTPVGLWGVWIGWCTDWLVRFICFRLRFRSGRWLAHSVLD